MTIKKHLLLMILLPLVSAKKNVYCEVEKSDTLHTTLFGSPKAICKNISIHENEVIKVRGYSQILEVKLISISADVRISMLQYFTKAYSLVISNSNISSFSLQSGIKRLHVSNSIFPRVTSDVLMGCKNLTHVIFMSNYGLQIDKGAFKHLRRLEELLIVNQTLPKLQRGTFEGLKNLSGLGLVLDNIQEMDEDAFMDFPNLKFVLLDGNPIESFNVNISGLTKLIMLSLFNTNLKRLDIDGLGSASQLGFINLSGQSLRTINTTQLVTQVPRLALIGVISKDLECPEVIAVVAKLKELGIQALPVHIDKSELNNFIKPSPC